MEEELISHLNDGEEVGAVAGELQGAALRVGPFLAPAVLHHCVLLLPARIGIDQLPRQPGGCGSIIIFSIDLTIHDEEAMMTE